MKFIEMKRRVLDRLFPLAKEVQELRDQVIELQSWETTAQGALDAYESGDLVTEAVLDEVLAEYAEEHVTNERLNSIESKLPQKWDIDVGESAIESAIEGFPDEAAWTQLEQRLTRLEEAITDKGCVDSLTKVLLQHLTNNGIYSIDMPTKGKWSRWSVHSSAEQV